MVKARRPKKTADSRVRRSGLFGFVFYLMLLINTFLVVTPSAVSTLTTT